MPISDEMIKVLCDPKTKKPVRMLENDKLEKLNDLIKSGEISDVSGQTVNEPVTEALITEDNKTIYRIDDDIPVMLAESGIPADQI